MTAGHRRQLCPHCSRPMRACICALVQRAGNLVELIILQHPMETGEAKNTGKLLHLCLENSQLHIGETFATEIFTRTTLETVDDNTNIYNLLLYPLTAEEKSLGIMTPPTIDYQKLGASSADKLRLWVLDATWRKSRKMLYLNSALQQMPRLNLINPPASLYTIRKAHSENQLSTLEASCYALRQLEHNRINYTPVLDAFAAFIKQHQTFIAPNDWT